MVGPQLPTGAYLAAVDQIADVWTFLILREAFFGARRFGEFASALHVSRARLSERLKHLLDIGLLDRGPHGPTSGRSVYRLTDRGIATYPIALTLIAWATRWRTPAREPTLVHKPCGNPLVLKMICRHCGAEVHYEDIQWPELIPLASAYQRGSNVRNWRKMASFDGVSNRLDPAMATLQAFGDRWSMLIMYGAQKGPFRFGQAQSLLGTATNILSDRLKHLVDQRLLARSDPSRTASYQTTEAGRALFSCILAIRTWATDWLTPGPAGWSKVTHKLCGADLRTTCVCSACGNPAHARNTRYRPPAPFADNPAAAP